MRVTHVITRLIIGGAQENTIATVLGLHGKSGMEMNLISGPTTGPEGSLENSFAKNPELLTIVPNLIRPINPIQDFLALRALEKNFCATRPDIVHTHSGKAGVLGRLAAHRAGVPVIIHTIHGPSFGNFQGRASNFIFRAAERYVGNFTTHFVSVAHAISEQYLAAGIGSGTGVSPVRFRYRENIDTDTHGRDARATKYTRVFSGFPLEPFLCAKNDFDLRAPLGIAPTDFVVGKIARLFELKGHDDLIDVAPELVKKNPRIKFLFVGDGAWRERFENRIRALGLTPHFIFTGLVPPHEVARYIGVMDVVVHLSRREGLARALPQALAAARPVIAYDCDGAREVCFENETGFLISPGDLKTLRDRLLQLAADETLRRQFGERGRKFVQENFSLERMLGDLEKLYLSFRSSRRKEAWPR